MLSRTDLVNISNLLNGTKELTIIRNGAAIVDFIVSVNSSTNMRLLTELLLLIVILHYYYDYYY